MVFSSSAAPSLPSLLYATPGDDAPQTHSVVHDGTWESFLPCFLEHLGKLQREQRIKQDREGTAQLSGLQLTERMEKVFLDYELKPE